MTSFTRARARKTTCSAYEDILAGRNTIEGQYYCGSAGPSLLGLRLEVGWQVSATWRPPGKLHKKHWDLLVIYELWSEQNRKRGPWCFSTIQVSKPKFILVWEFLSPSLHFSAFSFPDKSSSNSYGWNKSPVGKSLAKTTTTTTMTITTKTPTVFNTTHLKSTLFQMT